MNFVTAPVRRCISHACAAMILALAAMLMPAGLMAAPYADFVIDARTGEVLHQENADTRLHPASLTKMMTLYIAFEAIEHGEISLDTMVTVSKHAAGMAPSRLGLKPGQKIALRYLIRAAAIKSANDAATAIGEAIEGSEPAFAKRMNRTAKALGMTKTTFKNANGLTAEGHMSTARDMTTLGRRLFYDFPQYYGIFSRRTADAGVAQVAHTNRRLLDSYPGADGIKTGYTVAAGFNLVASAQRGNKRVIATVFGGKSTASRNARVAELMDMGFGKSPNNVEVQPPPAVDYLAHAEAPEAEQLAEATITDEPADDMLAEAIAANVDMSIPAAGKTLRIDTAVSASPRPRMRPLPAEAPVAIAALPPAEVQAEDASIALEATEMAASTDALMASMEDTLTAALLEAQAEDTGEDRPDGSQAEPTVLAEASSDSGADMLADQPVAQGTDTGIEPTMVAANDEVARPMRRPLKTVADPEPAATEVAATDVAEAGPLVSTGKIGLVTPVSASMTSDPALTQEGLMQTALLSSLPSAQVHQEPIDASEPAQDKLAKSIVLTKPEPKPDPDGGELVLASADASGETTSETNALPTQDEVEIVTRVSTSGGREWGINVGSFGSRYNAERELLRTALVEMATLDEALRKVSSRKGAFDANFVGMTEADAQLACARLSARGGTCKILSPTAAE